MEIVFKWDYIKLCLFPYLCMISIVILQVILDGLKQLEKKQKDQLTENEFQSYMDDCLALDNFRPFHHLVSFFPNYCI